MQRLKIDQDIKPLSEVRTGIANFIKQVHDTKRPVIITQHGKGVAVLLDAHEYEAMQEKLELLTDVQLSLNQLESGQGIDHENAKEKVKAFELNIQKLILIKIEFYLICFRYFLAIPFLVNLLFNLYL